MIGKLAEAKDELDIDEEEETKPAASGPQYEQQSHRHAQRHAEYGPE